MKARAGEDEGMVTRSGKDAEGESNGFRERNRTREDEWSLERFRGTAKDRESRERRRKRQRLCSG